jgi:glycosyltransferase involved in cell wall biosynthesis
VWNLSGSERRFFHVFRRVPEGRANCYVLQTPPVQLPEDEGIHGFPVNVAVRSSLAKAFAEWLLKGYDAAERVVRMVGGVDAVYATNNNLFNLGLGAFLSRKLGLPLAVVAHHLRWVDYRRGRDRFHFLPCLDSMRRNGLDFLPAFQRTLGAGVESELLTKADLLLTVSRAAGDTLRVSAPRTRIAITGNGVDLPSLPRSHGHRIYDALYVGRLDEGKGIPDLIDLWSRMMARRRSVRLCVAGGGFLLEGARALSAERGLGDLVDFRGFVGDADLERLYRSARIFVTLSTTEGWGLAIGEALARGLPVVAYDIPPLREVWGACEAVTLVPVGDMERVDDCVRSLLSLDDEGYGRLQRTARSFVERYRWRDVAMREYEALTQLVGKG